MAFFYYEKRFFFETKGAKKSIWKKKKHEANFKKYPHVPGNAGKYFYFQWCYSLKAEEEEEDMDPGVVSMTWQDEDGKGRT